VLHMKDMRHAFGRRSAPAPDMVAETMGEQRIGPEPRMILRSSQTVSACSQLDTTMT
jgi:hypothetical protein